MGLRKGGITRQQTRFAEAYAMSGNVTYAAQKAGYAGQGGGSMALRSQTVRDRIAAIRAKHREDGAELAFSTLKTVMRSKSDTGSSKVAAAREMLKHVLDPNESEGMSPEEQTAHELLQAGIAALDRLENMKVIEGETVDQAEPEPTIFD